MGILVNVYRRADCVDCSNNGISSQFNTLLVINCEGPFVASPTCPAVILESHVEGCLRIVPVSVSGDRLGGMFGGSFASTSDSRFTAKCRELLGHEFYGAVAIHDRFE